MKSQRHDKISLALYEAVKQDYANGRKTSEIAAWHKIGESTANYIRRSDSYLAYQMAVANKRIDKMTSKQAQSELERIAKSQMARPELVNRAKVVTPITINLVVAKKKRKIDIGKACLITLDIVSTLALCIAVGIMIAFIITFVAGVCNG